MKCPLCDGPVVNGRCRQCGMPYKNDELLYHLNEDRRTHEKHATDKAKEELLKRMVPLGDTAKQTSSRTVNKNTQKKSSKTIGRSTSQTTEKKARNNQKAAARSKKEFGRSNNSSWSSEKKPKKKKSLGGIIFWIIVIFMIARPFVDDFVTSLRARRLYNEYLESTSERSALKEVIEGADIEEDDIPDTDTYGFSSWSGSDGKMEYGLSAGYGSIIVGEELPAGIYEIYTNSDEVTLICEKADTGEEKIWNLWEGETITQPLKKGDVLELMQDEDSYKSVYFKETEG
nr:hypothetical protein [uncultured Blautia sp.]